MGFNINNGQATVFAVLIKFCMSVFFRLYLYFSMRTELFVISFQISGKSMEKSVQDFHFGIQLHCLLLKNLHKSVDDWEILGH
jgi:hypothetical protein